MASFSSTIEKWCSYNLRREPQYILGDSVQHFQKLQTYLLVYAAWVHLTFAPKKLIVHCKHFEQFPVTNLKRLLIIKFNTLQLLYALLSDNIYLRATSYNLLHANAAKAPNDAKPSALNQSMAGDATEAVVLFVVGLSKLMLKVLLLLPMTIPRVNSAGSAVESTYLSIGVGKGMPFCAAT